jgi:hypothetical protein
MHIVGVLSIRYTSQKEVYKEKGALKVFIEKSLGSQENLAIGNIRPYEVESYVVCLAILGSPSSQARLKRNTGQWHW